MGGKLDDINSTVYGDAAAVDSVRWNLRQSTTRANAAKIVQSTAKAIAEVKRMLVERQVLRNFTMPLAVGKA